MVYPKLSLIHNKKIGFTLIEILTVIAILGILAGMVFSSSMSGLQSSRDARRKEDLENIRKAVELYNNDVGVYPEELTFGDVLEDPQFRGSPNPIIYMRQIPKDPIAATTDLAYVYVRDDENTFRLYACLENDEDKDILSAPSEALTQGCGGICTNSCNYGISSGNTIP